MPQYVYGVVEANAKVPRGRGIGNAPLRLIADGAAAALASDLPDGELQLGHDDMLTHARVLEAAISIGTVLPMRFGVVMSGPEEIRERLLEDHAAELAMQLEDFDGKVEIRIRASYEADALLREVVREDPEIQAIQRSMAGRSGQATYYARIELGERVAAAVQNKREHDAVAILDALSPLALAIDETETDHERIVLNASFLVQRAALERFDEVLEAVAAGNAGRLRFKYTGPLPPHSFVQLAGST